MIRSSASKLCSLLDVAVKFDASRAVPTLPMTPCEHQALAGMGPASAFAAEVPA